MDCPFDLVLDRADRDAKHALTTSEDVDHLLF
jgi:hypothetical protein